MDLCLDDVSSVVQLVREVCDRWDDPQAWRQHLLQGTCTLLRAKNVLLKIANPEAFVVTLIEPR